VSYLGNGGAWDDDGVEMDGAADDLIRLDGAFSAAWADYRRFSMAPIIPNSRTRNKQECYNLFALRNCALEIIY
jgi:hypothetical protein